MTRRKRNRRLTEAELEDLHFENEMLKLKLEAETGARIGISDQLPPEIENIFLRQVQEFDEAMRNSKLVLLSQLLGNPVVKNDEDLTDEELKEELEKLRSLMASNQVVLDTFHTYDDRTIYRFITKELFQLQTDDVYVPGFIRHFTYESFYPDHKADIRDAAAEFFYSWFSRNTDELMPQFSKHIILSDGRVVNREVIRDKFEKIFESFTAISENDFSITESYFSWDDAEKTGTGAIKGTANYTAQLENGELVKLDGPFELKMINNYGIWEINALQIPGFN